MFAQLADILIDLVNQVGLIGIFIATALESFFAPIPSEIVLPTAGLAVRESGGIELFLLACLTAALGSYVGTLPFYLVSRFGAKTVLPKFLSKWGPYLLLSSESLQRAEELFAKRGKPIVFFSRLLPAVRSLVAFPAGLSQMSFGWYTLLTLLGSFVWNLLLIGVGYIAYDQKEQIFAIIEPVEGVVLAILVILTLWYVGRVILKIRKLKLESKT